MAFQCSYSTLQNVPRTLKTMLKVHHDISGGCAACRSANGLGFDVTMAFQPIVNTETRSVWAYEALVRGTEGQSAPEVLARVDEENRYLFDQTCRVKAVELAARLGVAKRGAKLSMNFMPGAVYNAATCLRRTLQAATFHQFPLDAIIFEITEGERMISTAHMQNIAREYVKTGFTVALDDFGAGFSGLNLLAELPEIGLVKLDGALIRGIEGNPRAERIVRSMIRLCRELGVEVLAECVETEAEYTALRELGIELMQGFLFARPAVAALPEVCLPAPVEHVPVPVRYAPERADASLVCSAA